MSEIEEHHPSCKPNDKHLVWHCDQCGMNETSIEYPDILREAQEKIKALESNDVVAAPYRHLACTQKIATLEARIKWLELNREQDLKEINGQIRYSKLLEASNKKMLKALKEICRWLEHYRPDVAEHIAKEALLTPSDDK